MTNELTKRILSSILLIPVVLFFVIMGNYYFNFFIFVCLIISIYEWIHISKNKKYNIPGVFFLIISFYSVYYLRNGINEHYIYFILILFICIFTDIGGYIFGKILKGPKLTKISPKKTYAGVLGGYFCSIIFIIFFLNYTDFIFEMINIEKLKMKFSINLFVFTIIISTVSQLGDILISYFKRKAKIKNTGKIIPGHGGLLDRIDGMIFSFPASYLILKFPY